MTSTARRQWPVPTALIMLAAVPLIAGGVRLSQLIGGAEITPENVRFFNAPVPVIVHIISITLFAVLGPFQFVPGFRRRKPRWHRVAGRVVIVSGFGLALSGLWMTLFYDLPDHDGALLGVIRVVVSSAVVVSLVLGFQAIRRRDIARHRAWMIRAYAIAMGAGTQVFTLGSWTVIAGRPGPFVTALLMLAAWLLNLAFAEWIIRRRPRPVRRSTPPTGADRHSTLTAPRGTHSW